MLVEVEVEVEVEVDVIIEGLRLVAEKDELDRPTPRIKFGFPNVHRMIG